MTHKTDKMLSGLKKARNINKQFGSLSPEDAIKLGGWVKQTRQRLGFSQEDFAELCGLPTTRVCKIEHGKGIAFHLDLFSTVIEIEKKSILEQAKISNEGKAIALAYGNNPIPIKRRPRKTFSRPHLTKNKKMIGEKVRQWRQENSLTIKKASEKLSINPSMFQRLENGYISSHIDLSNIAEMLNITIDELLSNSVSSTLKDNDITLTKKVSFKNLKIIGRNIALKRMSLGLSQPILGKLLDMSSSQISRAERGVLSVLPIKECANALNTTIQSLLDNTPKKFRLEIITKQYTHLKNAIKNCPEKVAAKEVPNTSIAPRCKLVNPKKVFLEQILLFVQNLYIEEKISKQTCDLLALGFYDIYKEEKGEEERDVIKDIMAKL